MEEKLLSFAEETEGAGAPPGGFPDTAVNCSRCSGKIAEECAADFVFEKDPPAKETQRVLSRSALYLVACGEGSLHTDAGVFPLRPGTVFLIFPMRPFFIEHERRLEYFCIPFAGQHLLSAAERAGLTEGSAVRAGQEDLIFCWKNAFMDCVPGNIDLVAESVLLYSFSRLAADPLPRRSPPQMQSRPSGAAQNLRDYADAHYCDTDLTLTALAERMSYNYKYLSDIFSREFGIGFRAYVQSLRIRRACELIRSGITCSKEIASRIGFADPLYFSKVFTRVTGRSPKQYIADLREWGTGGEEQGEKSECGE